MSLSERIAATLDRLTRELEQVQAELFTLQVQQEARQIVNERHRERIIARVLAMYQRDCDLIDAMEDVEVFCIIPMICED